MSMAGYTKLFNSILASTIWRAPDKTRIVWITLLAMADKDGVAEGSVPGLADFARVSLEDCEAALSELMGPDKYSRSSEHDGRRIEAIDGVGWQLLNHGKYRAKMSEDERREYNRIKQGECRDRKKKSAGVIDSQSQSAVSAHTEAEAEAEAEADTEAEAEAEADTEAKAETNSKAVTKAKKEKDPAPTSTTWDAYAQAYLQRYKVAPVRNARVNGQLSQYVARVGAEEAPQVAAFYVTHNNTFYVTKGHPIGLLLADAEKLRTEWATNTQITTTKARQADRKQNNLTVYEEVSRERGYS